MIDDEPAPDRAEVPEPVEHAVGLSAGPCLSVLLE